ncbi:MAG: vitamin K epoxide reductase family protein [Candidatus Pacebacteria bacterium]|nr:vitamin K epoxide reductase family protein [Candidatus Paceibacterota bacterium]
MQPLLAKIIVIFLGILGFILALWIKHKKQKKEPMVCPFNGECGAVINSRYSTFFGIDLAYVGMAYYVFIAGIYWFMLMFSQIVVPELVFFVLLVTTFAFLFSLYLTGVQAFILKQWCTWCLCSVALCSLIFVVTISGIQLDIVSLLAQYKGIIVLFHAIAAAIGVGAVTITDIFFFRFLKDYRISHDEAAIMHTLSNVIWFALGLLVLTGIGLFIPESGILLLKSKFIMKMLLILVLIINGVLLNLVIHPRLVDISFGDATVDHPGELHHLRKLAYAFGGVSLVTWYGVFILGSFRDIPLSFGQLFSIYALLIAVAVAGSQYMDYLMTHKKI